MTTPSKQELLALLEPAGQQHLLAFWDALDEPGQRRLAEQVSQLDLDLVARLYQGHEEGPDWHQLAARAEPPRSVRLDGSGSAFSPAKARRRGIEAIEAGKLAVVLVAGGLGSRLGFEHPKGMFPLGPVSNRTIFQILIELLQAVRARHQVDIPLYVMTSPATHNETVAFLDEHQRLGLPAKDLRIFCQGVMPVVDDQAGKILLAEKDSLALGPDGHGGMLAALAKSGCLADAQARGIEQIFYGQIDNPLIQLCDPLLVGFHLLSKSELTTQVVAKVDPLERVGNVVTLDGQLRIIEYSDLPEDAARRVDQQGRPLLWAGNIAVHIFDVDFLQRMLDRDDALPFHRAHKKTPYIDERGRTIEPNEPNSIKFERFIFDLLPAASGALAVEGDKADSFAPVKNADGAATDTPAAARAAMTAQHARWLRAAGATVDEGVAVEINPLFALDAGELAEKIEPGVHIREATYFQ